MKNGVWIQVNKLNLIIIQKTPEETAGWYRKSAVKEGFKYHDFAGVGGGESLPIGGAPPDDLLLRKNPILHHPEEILLSNGGRLPYLLWRSNFGHWGKAKWN